MSGGRVLGVDPGGTASAGTLSDGQSPVGTVEKRADKFVATTADRHRPGAFGAAKLADEALLADCRARRDLAARFEALALEANGK